MILNPTPITLPEFSGIWIKSVTASPNMLIAEFAQWTGGHFLATGNPPRLMRLCSDPLVGPQVTDLVASLYEEMDRQSGLVNATMLRVVALDPSQPVSAIAFYPEKNHHKISDCFALCATDTIFADIFSSAMSTIANLAGLDIQSNA
jgi:hypothetical protein